MTKTFEIEDPKVQDIQEGDIVTFWHNFLTLGEITAKAIKDKSNRLRVAGYLQGDIHPLKIVREGREEVDNLPKQDGFYTPAHEGDPVTSFRVFSRIGGTWGELTHRGESNSDEYLWSYLEKVAKGDVKLNRLVWKSL